MLFSVFTPVGSVLGLGRGLFLRLLGLLVDIAGVVSAAREHDAKLVFIASPNNPTGNLTSENDVRELLSAGLIVVVDEAYYEFCGVTMAGLVPEFENLVVLRSRVWCYRLRCGPAG